MDGPSVTAIRDHINASWGLSAPATVGLLDPRHVMIYLASQEDLVRAWSRDSNMIENSLFRLFRWSPNFNPKYEYPITAAWVRFPYLPLPFFHTPLLREIVGTFGRFLRADQRTLELTHPMYALVCMEVDISQPLPSKVWIGTGKDEGFYQKMVFEGKLAFCHHCNLQGHSPTECRKALAKKTPRLPPASTAVAPKLPLKQATPTSLNPPKAQDKPPQTTWRQRSRNKEKKVVEFEEPTNQLPEPVTSKSGLVTTATIEQNDLSCTPHNAPD